MVFECLVKEAVVVPEARPGDNKHEEVLIFEKKMQFTILVVM